MISGIDRITASIIRRMMLWAGVRTGVRTGVKAGVEVIFSAINGH